MPLAQRVCIASCSRSRPRAASRSRRYSSLLSSRRALQKALRWTRTALTRQSSQPKKDSRPLMAATAPLTVEAPRPASTSRALWAATSSFVIGRPSANAARARTARRYFATVLSLRSSRRRWAA